MSAALSQDQLLQQLQWRYATKQFDASKKIPADLWQTLEKALVLAPSSFGLQPWKFFVVDSPDLRQQLLDHSWGQRQVVDASHLVVLAVKKDLQDADVERYIQSIAQVRQVAVDSLQGLSQSIKGLINGPTDVNAWATRQVYIALGQLLTSAALLGVDACPMEGFVPDKYNQVLGLDQQGYSAVVLCPVGYRAEGDKYATLPKVRYSVAELVQHL